MADVARVVAFHSTRQSEQAAQVVKLLQRFAPQVPTHTVPLCSQRRWPLRLRQQLIGSSPRWPAGQMCCECSLLLPYAREGHKKGRGRCDGADIFLQGGGVSVACIGAQVLMQYFMPHHLGVGKFAKELVPLRYCLPEAPLPAGHRTAEGRAAAGAPCGA
jgi:hypothetical protein